MMKPATTATPIRTASHSGDMCSLYVHGKRCLQLTGDEGGVVGELGGAFEDFADAEHHCLVEGSAYHLQAEIGRASCRERVCNDV